MTTEEWRPVAGHPMYRVSSEGRVMSLHLWNGRRDRILSGGIDVNGYRFVFLGVGRIRRVHKLVAEAFIGPASPGIQVRHLDGDSLNNAASNLAYGTQSDNEQDKIRLGTHPLASRTHCANGHPFIEGNLRRSSSPRRICATCCREAEARYRARRARRASGISEVAA